MLSAVNVTKILLFYYQNEKLIKSNINGTTLSHVKIQFIKVYDVKRRIFIHDF